MERKTERWRESKPHKKTTKPPALGDSGRLERNNRKTLAQRKYTWSEKIRETALECRKDTRSAKDPELLALMERRKEKGHSLQEHRKLSKQIWWRRRHLKTEAREKTLKQAEQDGRADKLLDMREITPEQLLTEYFEDLHGLQGDKNSSCSGAEKSDRQNRWAPRRSSQESKHGVSTLRPLSKR